MNDQQVIQFIRAGNDSGALNRLYKYFPSVRKMVLANGGNADDAEDVFQESLIILVKKVRNTDLRLTAQLSTYLYSICRYIWKDELKKRNRITTGELTDLSGFEEQDISATIIAESKAKLAEKALNDLKERCRELLLLFYHSRETLRNIAAKMGYTSENVAKNQKYKCLEAAKSRLKELQSSQQNF